MGNAAFYETTPSEQRISHPKLLSIFVKGTPLFVGAIIFSGCIFLLFNNPEEKQIFAPDAFMTATGWYTTGCGMTRATHALLTGNILRAIQFNLLLVLAVPIFAYYYLWWVTWTFSGRELPLPRITRRRIWVCVGFVIFFTVARNFPGDIPAFFARGRL